jgi:hypothetical protein
MRPTLAAVPAVIHLLQLDVTETVRRKAFG